MSSVTRISGNAEQHHNVSHDLINETATYLLSSIVKFDCFEVVISKHIAILTAALTRKLTEGTGNGFKGAVKQG